MNVLVFKVKAIPDLQGARRLWSLDGLSDKEVANIMFHKRRQETGGEQLRLHLQRIVNIAVIEYRDGKTQIDSIGKADSSEAQLIEQFYTRITSDNISLVSWNGYAFDIPLLQYRCMLHNLQAGYDLQADKNVSMASEIRHTALMDALAGGIKDADVPLDELATLLGYPASHLKKENIWDQYEQVGTEGIRNNSELEVLTTYLVYLRSKIMTGALLKGEFQSRCEALMDSIQILNKPHLVEFLADWQKLSGKV